MSLRITLVAACVAAVCAAPATASAATARHTSGYTYDDQQYPGTWDQPPVDGQSAPADTGATGDQGGSIPGDPSHPTRPATPTVPTVPTAPTPPVEPQQPVVPALPTVPATTGTVPGTTAMLRTDGKAAIPRGAPARVRAIIAAANQIVGKPYKWGGGHAKLVDTGYDCSGAVSYSLIGAGVLAGPMVSGTLALWAAHGDGRWLTVYANKDHVYMEVAGLRLDTSPVGDPTGKMGVRWRPLIGRRTGFHARHPLGY